MRVCHTHIVCTDLHKKGNSFMILPVSHNPSSSARNYMCRRHLASYGGVCWESSMSLQPKVLDI